MYIGAITVNNLRTSMTVDASARSRYTLSVDMPYLDLRVRAEAACNTATFSRTRARHTPNKEDKDVAAG